MPRGHVFSNNQLISNLTSECDALKNAAQMPPITHHPSPITHHPLTHSPAHPFTHSLLIPHLFLQPCHMPPPQRLHFAAQAEVLTNGIITQDTKAVYNSHRLTGPFHNFFGIQVQVLFMRNGQYEGFSSMQCSGKVFFYR